MNTGFWACFVLAPFFFGMALVFAFGKEKTAKLVSGFNSLSKAEQARYDKALIARDMQNACFLWAAVMLSGAALCCLWTPYAAVAAYLIWGILFFKDVHFDAGKAFEKYLLK